MILLLPSFYYPFYYYHPVGTEYSQERNSVVDMRSRPKVHFTTPSLLSDEVRKKVELMKWKGDKF